MIKSFYATQHFLCLLYTNHILLYHVNDSGTLSLNKKIAVRSFNSSSVAYMRCISEEKFLFVLDVNGQKKILILTEKEVLYEKIIPFQPLILSISGDEKNMEVLFAFKQEKGICFALYNPFQDTIKLVSPAFHQPTLGFWNSKQELIGINEGDKACIYDYRGNELLAINHFDLKQVKLLSYSDPFILFALTDGDLEQAAYFDLQKGERVVLDIYASEITRVSVTNHRLLFECIHNGRWHYVVHCLNSGQTQILDQLPGVITGGMLSKDGTTLLGRYESFSISPTVCSYTMASKELTVFDSDGVEMNLKTHQVFKPVYQTFTYEGTEVPFFSLNDHVQDKALIYLHGGPHSFSTETYSPMITALVEQQFRVLSVNYPGSTGFGKSYKNTLKNDWGGLDLDSIYFLRHTLLKDYDQVSVYGTSYGAYLALLAAGKDPSSWDKIIACAPFTDLQQLYATADAKLREFLEESIGDLLNDQAEAMKRSPIHYVEQLHSSKILLIHGEHDHVCPITQTEEFYEALKAINENDEHVGFIKMKDKGHETYGERFWTDPVIQFVSTTEELRIGYD